MRLRITTAAMTRKKFREDFSKIKELHLAKLETIYLDLQRRHVIGTQLDARQLVLFFEGFNYARASSDPDAQAELQGAWLEMLHVLLSVA